MKKKQARCIRCEFDTCPPMQMSLSVHLCPIKPNKLLIINLRLIALGPKAVFNDDIMRERKRERIGTDIKKDSKSDKGGKRQRRSRGISSILEKEWNMCCCVSCQGFSSGWVWILQTDKSLGLR